MILKASQRGGGRQLATHLLNGVDNERVEIMDVLGSIADDIPGAFSEWEDHSTATYCKKYLYSMSVSPEPAQGRLTRDQYTDYIARVEKEFGLESQPRAIVFHVKNTREHAHVVWSRIDTKKMKAVQLSHDRRS